MFYFGRVHEVLHVCVPIVLGTGLTSLGITILGRKAKILAQLVLADMDVAGFDDDVVWMDQEDCFFILEQVVAFVHLHRPALKQQLIVAGPSLFVLSEVH